MRNRKWVSALDLNRWADTTDAKPRLPELIRRLVLATVDKKDFEHIDFPAGEEAHRPGYDGETKTWNGNPKVPRGVAYWEMGANIGIKAKLDEDYEKRLKARGEGDFSQVTYIAVTPRDYQNKKEWVEARKKEGTWGDVRLYDSDDLEQWLEMAPGVALWLARFTSKAPKGLVDLATHWENVQATLKQKLPASTLLAGRKDTVELFRKWAAEPATTLAISSQYPPEIVDAFAAWVESLPTQDQSGIASRAVIIETVDSWRVLADSEQKLLLIRAPQLELTPELIAQAERNGHHVLLPLSPLAAQKNARLEQLDSTALREILVKAGLTEQDAQSLAQHCGGSFYVLRRRFSGQSFVRTPPWGEPAAAAELAPLLLIGAWADKSPADRAIVSKVSVLPYDQVSKILNRWRAEPDAPVRWSNGVWEFTSPQDAWTFLCKAITPAHLTAFEEAAQQILGTNHPRLEIPVDERWTAGIHGKVLPHSEHIRKGLARTLALLATRDDQSQVADTVALQARVNRTVARIVQDASWQRWASLGDLLPTLAEAAPEPLLDAIEADLRKGDPELPKLFVQEGRDAAMGGIEHSGLLWALERLAWSSTYLARAANALAKLAERDPGGRYANRPSNSLTDIFCPWMPFTAASLDDRAKIMNSLLTKHPAIGWKLVVSLLPGDSEFIMHRETPEWRSWAAGWTRGSKRGEYVRNSQALMNLAIGAAEAKADRWVELINHLPSFSEEEFKKAVAALGATADKISPDLRQKLWTIVDTEIKRHRAYSTADWAMSSEALTLLEGARDKLQPSDPIDLALPLFTTGFERYGDRKLSWQEREEKHREACANLINAILAKHGFDGVLKLARAANSPSFVGLSLAQATDGKFEAQVLPTLLTSPEKPLADLASGYAAQRAHTGKEAWIKSLRLKDWKPDETGIVLSKMSFNAATWRMVEELGKEVGDSYWRRVLYFARLTPEEVEEAARKLSQAGRGSAAIDLLAGSLHDKSSPKPETLLELVRLALDSQSSASHQPLQQYDLTTLCSHLQKQNLDEAKLSDLEWILLPALDDRHPPVTLHKKLAKDPDFFIEVLCKHYRPRTRDKSKDTEPSEAESQSLKRIYGLLHEWRTVPGTQSDGSVNVDQLRSWIKEVREKAAADRKEVADITIGGVFAYAPADADGSWPCVAIREIIEEVDSEELERGLDVGIANKRGVHWRDPSEGGKQERELAAKYQAYADKFKAQWPRTAKVLKGVADDYLEQARQEDADAEI